MVRMQLTPLSCAPLDEIAISCMYCNGRESRTEKHEGFSVLDVLCDAQAEAGVPARTRRQRVLLT